jgi:hypothetical protein
MCQVGSWVSLLRMDEMWEFGRISKEEDRSLVGNKIPTTIVTSELHSKPSRVSRTVAGSGFPCNCQISDGHRTFLALLAEQVREADVIQRLCTIENTMCATAFGVDNSLCDSLSIEKGEEAH